MIRLAKWFALRPFGIGCAIGLIVNLGLIPLIDRSQTARAATEMDSPICSPDPSRTTEVENYVQRQCQVHAAIFNDSTEPAGGYLLDSGVLAPGKYLGHDYLGRPVSLSAAYVVPQDLKTLAPTLHARGFEASVVFGTLTGPAGSICVQGLVLLTPGATLETGHYIVVTGTLTANEVSQLGVVSRLEAGTRILDTTTGKTMSLADVQADPNRWRQAWANASDTSLLFATPNTDGAGVDWLCVGQADDDFATCKKACLSGLAVALATIIIGLVFCVDACAGLMATGPIGILLGATCAGLCWVQHLALTAVALAACIACVLICNNFHTSALRGCGLVIVEQ